MTLPRGVSDPQSIRKAAGECLKRVPLSQKIRLLGVRAGGLVAVNELLAEAVSVQTELPF